MEMEMTAQDLRIEFYGDGDARAYDHDEIDLMNKYAEIYHENKLKKLNLIESMTLSQYLNQETPLRYPSVLLEEGEYKLGSHIYSGGKRLTSVFITDIQFLNAFGSIGNEYIVVDNNPNLMTIDKDGNPKSYSVFNINTKSLK